MADFGVSASIESKLKEMLRLSKKKNGDYVIYRKSKTCLSVVGW